MGRFFLRSRVSYKWRHKRVCRGRDYLGIAKFNSKANFKIDINADYYSDSGNIFISDKCSYDLGGGLLV